MARRPDNLKGTNLTAPINRLEPGEVALASNVRAYGDGSFELRTGLSDPIFTVEKPGAGGTKIPQAVISARKTSAARSATSRHGLFPQRTAPPPSNPRMTSKQARLSR
jgi:hypothetical protein